MRRLIGPTLVLLLGVLVAYLCTSREIYRYLRPDFLPLMAATAAALVMLGLWSVAEARLDDDHAHDGGSHADHGHDHSRLPRVGLLLLVPMLVFSLARPEPLGSFSVDAAVARRPSGSRTQYQQYPALPADRVTTMDLERFTRMFLEDPTNLDQKPVRVLGFVSKIRKRNDAPSVNRLKVFCCAADALPFTARLVGGDVPADGWIEVTGHLDLAQSDDVYPAFVVTSLTSVPEPKEPYL